MAHKVYLFWDKALMNVNNSCKSTYMRIFLKETSSFPFLTLLKHHVLLEVTCLGNRLVSELR